MDKDFGSEPSVPLDYAHSEDHSQTFEECAMTCACTPSKPKRARTYSAREVNKQILSDWSSEISLQESLNVDKKDDFRGEKPKPKRFPPNRPNTLRRDVMIKSILRCMRIDFKEDFTHYLISQGENPKRRKLPLLSFLSGFSAEIFKTNFPEWTSSRVPGEFTDYLGIFINMQKMKKAYTTKKRLLLLDSFCELISHYSHQKFQKFISNQHVQMIFIITIAEEKIDAFIQRHDVLRRNPVAYKKQIMYIHDLLTHVNE